MIRRFPISGKLALAFALAVFLPLVILAYATYTATTNLTQENAEAIIAETGVRRQQAIENDFTRALDAINAFVNDPDAQAILTEPLAQIVAQNTFSPDAEAAVEDLFNDELFASPYFNSAWLQSPQRGEADTSIILGTQVEREGRLPFSQTFQREGRSQIASIGQALASQGGTDRQALSFTQRETSGGVVEPHVEVITLLYDDIDDEETLVGYMVVDLNLDAVVRSNFEQVSSLFDMYSFLLLGNNQYITTEDVRAQNLVDVNSNAVNRVQSDDVSGISTYEVGTEDNRREVIGYFTPISLEDETFVLVTELDSTAISGSILSRAGAIAFPVVMGGIFLVGILVALLNYWFTSPLDDLRQAMRGVIRGQFDVPVRGNNYGDELGAVVNAFTDMRQQVQQLTDDMNRRLRERTRDVRVTQDISRTVTAERDLQQLMNRVVQLIVENFPSIYHAQIFLIDSDEAFAVLRASTGEAGQQLLQRGHKLAVGSVSVIGQVTEQGQVITARDTTQSDVHRQNEFLSQTRAELAIPLRLGERIIGALDVQSKQRDTFDDDQIAALQTLADQITIAIENARLYEESARLLQSIDRDRNTRTRYAWQQYMNQQRRRGISTEAGNATGYDFGAIRRAVMANNKPIVGERTTRDTIPFGVPIKFRDQPLGVIECEVPASEFTYDKVLLAEELVNRLAVSLENARLFQESQEAAERERIVNEISAKLTEQTDINSIIQTAIREVGQALRTPQVAVRLQRSNGNGANGNGKPTDSPNMSGISTKRLDTGTLPSLAEIEAAADAPDDDDPNDSPAVNEAE